MEDVHDFDVVVTETYSKTYRVEAKDAQEARDIADALASNDMELACPENMNNRECEVN